ncbi:MAG: hydroxyethylthiazole kinase [Desulfobacula sp.]|jgi:hydroxyethylthiazole kinase|uniref:hydroxyethylthiazole kinase n=3 Tax=Desulfobacula sp. TaxID=2593537 RepID=UPI002A095A2C|nr:hydroxyethylthiazole kinase [Desulfobacula sp.]MBT4198938.1 hydroxyethylthiazole kinase [Desulfobacula sp.]MBT4875132.1 hydroxyethylthiazole kinase [Desulfobacula sp.]MBT5546383.1 hydroxyethylthiazole kinase [Desulfobacula sp.]MBT6749719.1 hydroxyethylthiazole kinase [Desulfobacula sp.]
MKINPSSIIKDVEKIRKNAPLVHNITNYVVMNTTANALLAIGASPVMAHAVPEVEDMAGIAGALVINIGTLSDAWIEAMFKAAKKALQRQIPIIIDPVGVGATQYRTRTARELIQASSPSIIRGNGSEIIALCKKDQRTKGVDSTNASDQAIDSAKSLAQEFNCVVCISGEKDYIVSQDAIIQVKNGHAMMPRVTGLGCTATALCGAFAAVNQEFDMAAAHAMAVMGIAGEMAGQNAPGPGTLQVNFIDALYQLSETHIKELFND